MTALKEKEIMNIFKNILIIVLFIALGYFIFFPHKRSDKVEKIPYPVKEYVETEVERVVKMIDDEGFEHAVTREVDNVIKRYEQLSDSAQIELDSVNRLLGIARNQLKEWRSYAITLEDSLLRAEKIGDTYVYSDKWSEIKFTPNEDAGHFSLKYDAKINYAEYWKKSWFLGKKKHYIDFWIEDPRATVNGVKRIKFEPKEPFLGFKIKASTFHLKDLRVGLDSDLRMGRFNINSGYFYNLDGEKWEPLIKLDYVISEF